MEWKPPPRIKVWEALGAIADRRIEVDGPTGKVYSSSGQKYYDVTYNAEAQEITANDNGSYWQGYLGYPAICYLFAAGIVPYPQDTASALKGIAWKDINTQFKNDFSKTEKYVFDRLKEMGIPSETYEQEIKDILAKIADLHLAKLGKTKFPPKGH